MDAAKVMWLRYENPDFDFIDMREKFFDIRKRAFAIPTPARLAKLICIPTISGTGAEITPLITADSGFDALTTPPRPSCPSRPTTSATDQPCTRSS